MTANSDIIKFLSTKYPVIVRDRKQVLIIEKPSQRMDIAKDISALMSIKYGKPAKRYEISENGERGDMFSSTTGLYAGSIFVLWTQAKQHHVHYDYPDRRRPKTYNYIEGKF